MVTILSAALTLPTGIEHERITSPLMCTEQAPHCATPQPYLVPVKPTCSRITQSSGVSSSTRTSRTLPLMFSLAIDRLPIYASLRRAAVDAVAGSRPAPIRGFLLLFEGSLARRRRAAYAVLSTSKVSDRPGAIEFPAPARGNIAQLWPRDLQTDAQSARRHAAMQKILTPILIIVIALLTL